LKKSCQNKNGICYKKLDEKSQIGNVKFENTYIRVTLNEPNGNAPGNMYVLEIWPIGHYSSIHNHGNTFAIIRVLYGEVMVNIYPYLSTEEKDPCDILLLKQNDYSYITPLFNQIHQLRNVNRSHICITLQCYQYPDQDNEHYQYFDYIHPKDNQNIHHFEPKRDFDYDELCRLLRLEYNQEYMAPF